MNTVYYRTKYGRAAGVFWIVLAVISFYIGIRMMIAGCSTDVRPDESYCMIVIVVCALNLLIISGLKMAIGVWHIKYDMRHMTALCRVIGGLGSACAVLCVTLVGSESSFLLFAVAVGFCSAAFFVLAGTFRKLNTTGIVGTSWYVPGILYGIGGLMFIISLIKMISGFSRGMRGNDGVILLVVILILLLAMAGVIFSGLYMRQREWDAYGRSERKIYGYGHGGQSWGRQGQQYYGQYQGQQYYGQSWGQQGQQYYGQAWGQQGQGQQYYG